MGRDEKPMGGLPRAQVGKPPCEHLTGGYPARAYAIVCRDCGAWWLGDEVRKAQGDRAWCGTCRGASEVRAGDDWRDCAACDATGWAKP